MLGAGLLVIQPIADRLKTCLKTVIIFTIFLLVQEQHTSVLKVLQKDMVVFNMLSYEQSFSNLLLIPKHVNNTIASFCTFFIFLSKWIAEDQTTWVLFSLLLCSAVNHWPSSTRRWCFCVFENESGYFHQFLNDADSCLYWVCFGRAVRSLTRSCPCLCQRVREYRSLAADTNMSLIKNSHISLQNQNNI